MRVVSPSALSSFHFSFIVPLHPQVESLTQLVEKMGTVFTLTAFHIRIGVTTKTLDYHPEYPVSCKPPSRNCGFLSSLRCSVQPWRPEYRICFEKATCERTFQPVAGAAFSRLPLATVLYFSDTILIGKNDKPLHSQPRPS